METILKLHQRNINQLKGHIRANGPSVIHGDGNIYPAAADNWTPTNGVMNHSYINATMSNANREEATYFKQYNTIDEVPATVEALQDELISKFKNAAQKRAQTVSVAAKTFDAYEDDEAPVKKAGKSDEEKAADKLASLKEKADTAAGKAEALEIKANADGATDKDKKAYETAKNLAEKLATEYNEANV